MTHAVARLPIVWSGVFAVFTVCCLLLATFANGSVGISVRPHAQDIVIFVAPRGDSGCPAGALRDGTVLAVSGDHVRAATAKAAGGRSVTQFVVNGQRRATLAPRSAIAPFTVPSGRAIVLSRTPVCEQRVLTTIAESNIVGYGRATVGTRIETIREELHQRVVAEKYVAAVYLLVTAFFGLWLFIHAGRVSRLERELAVVTANAAQRT